MASGVQDYECPMKEWSPILSEMILVISNGALCLEPARWVLTNKEKIKDRHDLEGAVFIFRPPYRWFPLCTYSRDGAISPTLPLKIQLTFSFQPCQLYILDARRTLPALIELCFVQEFTSLFWLLGEQCQSEWISTVGESE
jgi:hypothetical protein